MTNVINDHIKIPALKKFYQTKDGLISYSKSTNRVPLAQMSKSHRSKLYKCIFITKIGAWDFKSSKETPLNSSKFVIKRNNFIPSDNHQENVDPNLVENVRF